MYMKWKDLKSKYEAQGQAGNHVIDPAIQELLGDAISRLLDGPEFGEAEDLD